MEFNPTEEELAEIKEKILNMHSCIDQSRRALQLQIVPHTEESVEMPPPEPEDVEVWLNTGRWATFRRKVFNIMLVGVSNLGR